MLLVVHNFERYQIFYVIKFIRTLHYFLSLSPQAAGEILNNTQNIFFSFPYLKFKYFQTFVDFNELERQKKRSVMIIQLLFVCHVLDLLCVWLRNERTMANWLLYADDGRDSKGKLCNTILKVSGDIFRKFYFICILKMDFYSVN